MFVKMGYIDFYKPGSLDIWEILDNRDSPDILKSLDIVDSLDILNSLNFW